MPDLTLTPERKQYQDLAFEFAAKEIAVNAHKFDTSGEFPLDICQKAWALGLTGVRLPENLGGLGLGAFDACVIAEEFGAACMGIGAAFWGNELAIAPLLVAGSEQQKKQCLEPLVSEFALGAYGFSAGAVSYSRTASGFELIGEINAVNASYAKYMFVLATNHLKGSSAFVIPTGAEGVTIGGRMATLGMKAADLRQVRLHKVQVGLQALVGTEYGAAAVVSQADAVSNPVLGSYAVGIIRCALEHSLRYAKERYTMGVPIAKHQAVAFMLADMAKDAEAARFLLRKAAWMADDGHASAVQSAIGKNFACDAAMKAATDAVQVFGGYGYSREYPVEKLMRDAKMLQVLAYGGTVSKIEIAQEAITSAANLTKHR